MSASRTLRYVAPNLITMLSMLLGMISLAAAARGAYDTAGWMIIYATLSDRLDGFVARLVRGTSELGVQLDSFADFLNFGLAPSFLVYSALSAAPSLPFMDSPGRYVLMLACILWVFAAAFRLARYNITEDVPTEMPMRIFFGIPTTLAGGVLAVWFLALYKYSPEGPVFPGLPEPFGGTRLFDFTTPEAVWRYFPVVMLVGAYSMVSSLRMPHFGRLRSKVTTAIAFTLVFLGSVCGFAQVFPEYMVFPPTLWIVIFLVWGQTSPIARGMVPPPIFPPDPKP